MRHFRDRQDQNNENAYNEVYRHFDNLIWQVQSWSSAIFIGLIAMSEKSVFSEDTFINETLKFKLMYLGAFILLLLFSHTLYRFRLHQTRVKNKQDKWRMSSPQVLLQFLINLESFVLFILSIYTNIDNDIHKNLLCIFLFLPFFLIFLYQEYKIGKLRKGIRCKVPNIV